MHAMQSQAGLEFNPQHGVKTMPIYPVILGEKKQRFDVIRGVDGVYQ